MLYQQCKELLHPSFTYLSNILHFGDNKKKQTPGTAPSFQVFQTLGSPDEPLPAAAGRTTKCFCKLGLGWFGKLGRLQNPVATQILHASPPTDCGGFLKFIYLYLFPLIKTEHVILCCFVVFTLDKLVGCKPERTFVTSRVGFVESVEWC